MAPPSHVAPHQSGTTQSGTTQSGTTPLPRTGRRRPAPRTALTAAVAATGLLAGFAPTISAAAAPDSSGQAAHYQVVARYKAGTTSFTDPDGGVYASDATLRPGGRLTSPAARSRAALGALYATSRRHVGAYHVGVPSAGNYRVTLRYVRCATAACSVVRRTVDASAGSDRQLTVVPTHVAHGRGVATIVVRQQVASGATTAASDPTGVMQPADVFGANSVWNQDVSSAPLASNSSAMVNNLTGQLQGRYGGIAAFNANQYSVNWYNADADTPTTTVLFNDCQHRHYTPPGLYGSNGPFVNVPIPADAVPSSGTDQTLTVYSPSTDQLWDFWRVQHDSAGWHACWGGRIDNASSNPGIFPKGFGASATSLAGEAGDVSISDAESGSIDHALSLAIPSPADFRTFSWPAQRSDGSSKLPDAIPEGTRLRLDPTIDVDALHLNPLGTMIAKAAQKYGFIVTNKSGAVAVTAESGTPSLNATGTNPWKQILGNTKSYLVMKNFPWQSLQALPMNYGG